MSGVFLSYSRGDRALAEQIIRGLRALGVVVWWDEDMGGVDWQEELERQISELAGVVVLWTPNSAASKHVKDEARLGLETEKLVNAIEGVPKPPFPYDRVNGLPLDGWNGREPHRGWARLVETIEEKVVEAGGAKTGEFSGALARRERDVRLKQQAIATTQGLFQDAQIRDGEAADAVKAAADALARAEEQHQRVVEMRASPAIQRTAQQELDDARTAKDTADKTQRAARADLSAASRALSHARTEFETLFSVSPDLAVPALPIDPLVKPASAEPPPPIIEHATAAKPKAPAPAPPAEPSPPPPVRPRAASRGRLLMAGAVLVGAVIGLFALTHHPARAPLAADPSSANVAESAAADPPPADPTAAAVRAASALAGAWAPDGLTCAKPVTLSVWDGALLMKVSGETSTTTIDPSPNAGEIDAHDSAGGKYSYKLSQNALSVVGPSGPIMKMTKCAG